MFLERLADALTGRVLDILLPPLVTAIATLLVALLAKQLQKIGLTVTEQQRDAMKSTVKDAIIAVEEEARRQPGVIIPGPVKEERAIEIAKVNAPKASEAELRQTIKAVLPVVRAAITERIADDDVRAAALYRATLTAAEKPGGFGRPKTAEEQAKRP